MESTTAIELSFFSHKWELLAEVESLFVTKAIEASS